MQFKQIVVTRREHISDTEYNTRDTQLLAYLAVIHASAYYCMCVLILIHAVRSYSPTSPSYSPTSPRCVYLLHYYIFLQPITYNQSTSSFSILNIRNTNFGTRDTCARILLYVCPHTNSCEPQLLAYLAVLQPD